MLSLIAIRGHISGTWKMMRSLIFNNILDHAIITKESGATSKPGYYHIIVRPIVKIIERNNVIIEDAEKTKYLSCHEKVCICLDKF